MTFSNLDVIIPTYNRADFLKIALDSLFSSTAQWRKTIILNNASTDNTIDVVEQAKEKYPDRSIEIITNDKNIGNAGNFIKTQKIADNEYVAIFHDDDAIHPEYIERAMTLINSDSEIVLASGNVVAQYNINDSNWDMLPNSFIEYPSIDNVFYQLLLGRTVFCTAIYKTSCYKKAKYEFQKYGKLHDVIFMMDIAKYGKTVVLQGVCARWRQHMNSDSNSLQTGPFVSEVINILKYMSSTLDEHTQTLGMIKRVLHRSLTQTLLFNFSYFMYCWSALSRFMTWKEFRLTMVDHSIFTSRELMWFDKYIDIFGNPMIRKKQAKYFRACFHSYVFRINGN